ncbi:MAG: class I SAM-dependent methyltransferase [Oligoflexia bacterium]|nr:class I SAM-dependent methyltransferase [Oligoflexia bacterium]
MKEFADSLSKTKHAQLMHQKNPTLRCWFEQVYQNHIDNFLKDDGPTIELGSGGSDFKSFFPHAKTTDILPLEGVDLVVDALNMPFESETISNITMVNVLHHLRDPVVFFKECERVLKPNGRLVFTEPHISIWSYPIYRFIHHEPCETRKNIWKLPEGDPLKISNQAIPTNIVVKNWNVVNQKCPRLSMKSVKFHSALSYFLTGGVNRGGLIPESAWRKINAWDSTMCDWAGRQIGSFLTAVIVKTR